MQTSPEGHVGIEWRDQKDVGKSALRMDEKLGWRAGRMQRRLDKQVTLYPNFYSNPAQQNWLDMEAQA